MTWRTSTAILFCAAMFSAAPALAADEAPISTAAKAVAPGTAVADVAAPATTPPQPIGDQIANYLATSPAATLDDEDETVGVISGEGLKREIHGEVSVAVGSHGYREVYARSDIPVGKTGQLSIAVQDSRGRGYYGHGGYGPGYYGPGGYGAGYYGFGHGLGGYGPGRSQSLGVGLAFGGGVTSRERCLDRWNDGGLSGRSGYECQRILREPTL